MVWFIQNNIDKLDSVGSTAILQYIYMEIDTFPYIATFSWDRGHFSKQYNVHEKK